MFYGKKKKINNKNKNYIDDANDYDITSCFPPTQAQLEAFIGLYMLIACTKP